MSSETAKSQGLVSSVVPSSKPSDMRILHRVTPEIWEVGPWQQQEVVRWERGSKIQVIRNRKQKTGKEQVSSEKRKGGQYRKGANDTENVWGSLKEPFYIYLKLYIMHLLSIYLSIIEMKLCHFGCQYSQEEPYTSPEPGTGNFLSCYCSG